MQFYPVNSFSLINICCHTTGKFVPGDTSTENGYLKLCFEENIPCGRDSSYLYEIIYRKVKTAQILPTSFLLCMFCTQPSLAMYSLTTSSVYLYFYFCFTSVFLGSRPEVSKQSLLKNKLGQIKGGYCVFASIFQMMMKLVNIYKIEWNFITISVLSWLSNFWEYFQTGKEQVILVCRDQKLIRQT